MISLEEILEDDMLVMDGFNDCVVGVAERAGGSRVLAYDTQKIVSKLVDQGMSVEEAIEFFEFNQLGAYVGEGTPVFITFLHYEHQDTSA